LGVKIITSVDRYLVDEIQDGSEKRKTATQMRCRFAETGLDSGLILFK
jgi:hypothetical protein